MVKILDVYDKETGKKIPMQSIDAKEAVNNDPKRYFLKGYSKAAEEPQQRVPTRARPVQTVPSTATARRRVEAADLSATSGEPDKPVNEEAKERMVAAEEGQAVAVPEPVRKARRTRSKPVAKKK